MRLTLERALFKILFWLGSRKSSMSLCPEGCSRSPEWDLRSWGRTSLVSLISLCGLHWMLQLSLFWTMKVKSKLCFMAFSRRCFSRDRVDKWDWSGTLELLKKSLGSLRLFGSLAPAVLNLLSLPYTQSI